MDLKRKVQQLIHLFIATPTTNNWLPKPVSVVGKALHIDVDVESNQGQNNEETDNQSAFSQPHLFICNDLFTLTAARLKVD